MSNQLARRPTDTAEIFTGTSRDSAKVTLALREAQERFHLVSPAAACGRLPEGCGVALSTVSIDIAEETYDVGMGKRGLSKSALDRIAAAAGITWDARQSRRLDDGSDPRYCAYKAVGTYRSFDGVEMQIMGEKEMDLRPGSPQVEALQARAASKNKDASGQIREMRLHILAHAETKARLRAIRSIGIRTAYTTKELDKPFVVARLMWTGETSDPELRRAFAMKQADAMLGGARALYGDAPMMPAGPALPAPRRPPPVGSVPVERDDIIEMPSSEPSREPSRTPAPERSSEPEPARQAPQGDVPTVAFGNKAGTPITELSDRDLDWYTGAVEKSVNDPARERFRASNERVLEACRAEQARRAGGSSHDGDDDRGDDPNAY